MDGSWIGEVFRTASPISVALFASLLFNFMLLRAAIQLVRQKSATEVAVLDTLRTSASALTDAASAARETATRVGALEIAFSRVEALRGQETRR